MSLNKTAVFSFLILFAVFSSVFAIELTGEFYPAKVKDISDRAYEPALIELLDKAERSIVISMYNISLGANERNPIAFLLQDLLEARQRNVEVVMYVNTNFREIDKAPNQFVNTPFFKNLSDAGCVIHLLPSRLRLHDKLIIVDSRFIVEGSTNWSISALKVSFESDTLMDSPELAGIKLSRLKALPLIDEPKKKEPHQRLYLENLPDSISLPKAVLLNSEYFPRLLTNSDARSMDLYLLLLAHSQAAGKQGFFIDIESMALSLDMPVSWLDFGLRRQVIKSLKKLDKQYNLVRVKFYHGKDAWVEIAALPREAFPVSSKLIIDRKLSQRLKFLLMVKSLLESRGENIYSISKQDLAKRFHIHSWTIGEAFKEMEQVDQLLR